MVNSILARLLAVLISGSQSSSAVVRVELKAFSGKNHAANANPGQCWQHRTGVLWSHPN